jgi:hypothetical protein
MKKVYIALASIGLIGVAYGATVWNKAGVVMQERSTGGAIRYRYITEQQLKNICSAPNPKPAPDPRVPPTNPPTPTPTPAPTPVPAPVPVPPPIFQQEFMPTVDTSKNIAPQAGFSELRVKSSAEPLYDGGGVGAFRISCGVSHMNNDDPMVFPNMKNATHHHTFYGNTSVQYNSDLSNLSTVGNSTCWGGIMNRSAYWHPTLIDTKTNAPVLPDGGAIFYYKTGYNGVPLSAITAPPTGLRMLVGNPRATNESQKRSTFYQCMSNGRRVPSIPNCGVGDTMQMEVEFPQCWDGKNLDSPDHISHMAEARGGCPASHPVAIPRITLNLRFKVTASNQALGWRLSSDNYAFNGSNAGYSGHADWVNGWDEGFFKGIVRNCLNAGRDGRAHLLCDGRQFY